MVAGFPDLSCTHSWCLVGCELGIVVCITIRWNSCTLCAIVLNASLLFRGNPADILMHITNLHKPDLTPLRKKKKMFQHINKNTQADRLELWYDQSSILPKPSDSTSKVIKVNFDLTRSLIRHKLIFQQVQQ